LAVRLGDNGASTLAYSAIAEDLAKEFGAPVGMFDPDRRRWRVLVGAGEELFPPLDDLLFSVCRSYEMLQGRALVWQRPGRGDRVWLVLPTPRTSTCELVALVAFRAGGHRASGPRRETAAKRDTGSGDLNLGPSCPEPALRLWGQQAVNRMRSEFGMGGSSAAAAPRRDTESDHVVIGRLIRRLRISDPPPRFQALATTVLRSSLNMTAVAWVPKDPRELVVIGGGGEHLESAGFRALPAPQGRETTMVVNDGRVGSSPGISAVIRRYASVTVGPMGWLVAVNPLDDRPIATPEVERLQYVASLIETQLANARIYADLKELLFGVIRALTAAIDAKDPYTSGHSERVARIAVRLAEELEMPAAKRSDLYLAGLLHDVGKIGIDDEVLKKLGPLTAEEYRKIQMHVEIGVTILRDLKKLHHILPGVRHHHESFDGTGYPDRLAGDGIPLEARILAVADSFDAMSSNRPYRKRLSLMRIDEIFRSGRGHQWDPDVVDALFACRGDVEEIRQKGLGESLIGAVDVTIGRG
jgi:putative nucleotidyltransferase with HDIG domain